MQLVARVSKIPNVSIRYLQITNRQPITVVPTLPAFKLHEFIVEIQLAKHKFDEPFVQECVTIEGVRSQPGLEPEENVSEILE